MTREVFASFFATDSDYFFDYYASCFGNVILPPLAECPACASTRQRHLSWWCFGAS